jgi:hypothetical protein
MYFPINSFLRLDHFPENDISLAIFSLLSLCPQRGHISYYTWQLGDAAKNPPKLFQFLTAGEDSNFMQHLLTAALSYRCFAQQHLQLAYVNRKKNIFTEIKKMETKTLSPHPLPANMDKISTCPPPPTSRLLTLGTRALIVHQRTPLD